MIIYTRGIAIIQHCVSKEEFEIHDDELDWEVVAENEQSMGQETIYEAFLDHEDLGDLRWSISEYPVGVENSTNAIVGSHIIVSDFKYGLEHEPELDEELPINLPNKLNDNSQWAAALTRGSLSNISLSGFTIIMKTPPWKRHGIVEKASISISKVDPITPKRNYVTILKVLFQKAL